MNLSRVCAFAVFFSASLTTAVRVSQAQLATTGPAPAPTESVVVGEHESAEDCLRKQTNPGGDCTCDAYPMETEREFTTVRGELVLAVSFKNEDALESGQGRDFGCWYRTNFKAPKGYILRGYQFKTVTDFGHCDLRWNSPGGPDLPALGKPFSHYQNRQDCGTLVPPLAGADVTLKYRLQGAEMLNESAGKNGPAFNANLSRFRTNGAFLVTVYFLPH